MTDELAFLRHIAAKPDDMAIRGAYADWLDEAGRGTEASAVRASFRFERRTIISPAWDRRPKKAGDPDYGVHGVELRMVLIGPRGAVQFLLYTNWMLPVVQEEWERRSVPSHLLRPLPADLGYHSPVAMYDNQTPHDDCEYLGGRPCFYDGSGLNAQDVFGVLLEKGSDGVWTYLEDYYRQTFHGEPDPDLLAVPRLAPEPGRE